MQTRSVLFAALFAGLLGTSVADDKKPEPFTPAQLTECVLHRRAVGAVIWGMPAVNYDLMLQEMLTQTPGKVGQVIYWGRPLDAKNQTLTPNPDALYFMTFFDTKGGPIVLDLPPGDADGSFNGNIVTVWQMPLEDAGLLGVDKGKGGKFLVLPPGYKDKPPEGYIPLQSDTFGGYMLLRANFKSPADADVQKSVAYGKRMKVYPLSAATNPSVTVFSDVKDVDFDSTIKYDASFFAHLDRIVQSEPWLERDRLMIDQLKSLGIEKGKPFAPDARMKGILELAAKAGRDQLLVSAFASARPDRFAWKDRKWEWLGLVPESVQFETKGGVDLEARDRWFAQAIVTSPAMFRRTQGAGRCTGSATATVPARSWTAAKRTSSPFRSRSRRDCSGRSRSTTRLRGAKYGPRRTKLRCGHCSS